MTATEFRAGTLVTARGREWLVLPGSPSGTLLVRPLGGRDDETTVLLPELDRPSAAVFDAPSVDDRGDAARARLLRDALRLSFRATAGPFRSFAQLSVSPRNYQLVPLMMATSQETTRLLIADGVGIGKTIEAGLIAAELLACGDAQRLAVLCSPQLAPQWQSELRTKFGISAEVLLPSTANRLARSVPFGSTVYEHYPYLIVSTDYVKQRTRRDEFALLCPELVIVDEAHTCIAPSAIGSAQAHQRYMLLRRLADDQTRHLLLLTATPHNGDDGAWQSLIGLLDPRLGELPSDLSGTGREEDRRLLARFLIQRQRADIREYLSEDTPFPTRETAEESYKLTPEYRKLFDRVLSYAHEHVTDPSLNHVHRRVRWWSAIALLRSIASSPAAAQQTLLNRSDLKDIESTEAADAAAGPRVFDVELDDTTEGEDAALGADTSNDQSPDATARRRLRAFAGGPPLPWTVTTLGSLGTGGTPMVTKYQKFGDGYKAEAVKLYRESNQTIAETARNLGLKESTLANWVKKDKDNEAVAVGEAPLTPAERTRIRELEADVRRLNMENAFLKKASAYFASQNL